MVCKEPPAEGDDEIQSFLDRFFSRSCCSWCKEHNRPLYGRRLPLCDSCKRIRDRIRKFERLAKENPQRAERSFDYYGSELEVARRMKALAQQDGSEFADINSRSLEALDLEHIFVKVSKIAVRRDLFGNQATFLDNSFSKSQQRLLFFMMSQIVRAHHCKHRASIARKDLLDDLQG
jgi:hypothetical protein